MAREHWMSMAPRLSEADVILLIDGLDLISGQTADRDEMKASRHENPCFRGIKQR